MCKCECGKKGYEWRVVDGYRYFFISPEGEVLEAILSATNADWSYWDERRFISIEAAKAAVEKKYVAPVAPPADSFFDKCVQLYADLFEDDEEEDFAEELEALYHKECVLRRGPGS